MTVANVHVKCFHSKKLSNTDDILSGSGFAGSVGAPHPEISWHCTVISIWLFYFLSPVNTR